MRAVSTCYRLSINRQAQCFSAEREADLSSPHMGDLASRETKATYPVCKLDQGANFIPTAVGHRTSVGYGLMPMLMAAHTLASFIEPRV